MKQIFDAMLSITIFKASIELLQRNRIFNLQQKRAIHREISHRKTFQLDHLGSSKSNDGSRSIAQKRPGSPNLIAIGAFNALYETDATIKSSLQKPTFKENFYPNTLITLYNFGAV